MPLLLDQLGPCPVCGAAVAATGPLYRQHIAWHRLTDTYVMPSPEWLERVGYPDEAPTEKLPPIGATVRRRPPVPEVRELKGAELLRALAAELETDEGDDLP